MLREGACSWGVPALGGAWGGLVLGGPGEDPPPWLLLWAVRILLECILVLGFVIGVYCTCVCVLHVYMSMCVCVCLSVCLSVCFHFLISCDSELPRHDDNMIHCFS